MNQPKEPIVITPGLGNGVRVVTREVPYGQHDQEQPDQHGPTIPDDVSMSAPRGFPAYIRTAIESDVGHALSVAVCEELLRHFCNTLASTFAIAPHYLGDILSDLADELDLGPGAMPR